MAYRMKRNGAGLASVCILATMVLVMLSSTTSLYFGAEDSLMARYPRELSISYGVEDVEYLSDCSVKELREEILSVLEKGELHPAKCSGLAQPAYLWLPKRYPCRF